MRKSSLAIAVVVAAATLQTGSLRAQKKTLPALEGEIETTFRTPQGQFSTPGHYYRSRDGRVREDSPIGSIITDVRGGSVTLVNRATKEARVIRMAGARRPEAPGPALAPDAFEEGTVEGHAVKKARKTMGRTTAELWTAPDLGVALMSKVEAPDFAMTKVMRNLSLHEPDPDVFRIPNDYKVTHETAPPTPPNRPDLPMRSPLGSQLPLPR
jgi:hypothetical protein